MKNAFGLRLLIAINYVITFLLPIVLLSIKCTFTLFTFIEYLKEFSFPIWLSFFSFSWLYYKKIIKDNEHLSITNISQNETPVVAEEIKKRNASISSRINRRENAERSIKTLEIAMAIVGAIIGLLGIASYLGKFFLTPADN